MCEDLVPVALRVLTCFVSRPYKQPDPADVQRLRENVAGEAKKWLPHDLAAYVIKSKVKRLRVRHTSAA